MPATPQSDSELLGSNFKLVKLLGTGGMGAVWLAEDVGLQRQVALKLLAEKLCHDPELVERFLREARLMARVDHPNVVPVHFVGRWGHVPFIVMKLLSGRPLAEHAQGRPLGLADIASIARQVCAGLSALHAQGIVHRDIKPANLFVCDDGRVLLLDLGVARESDSKLTSTGALIGTPRYMAPEQIHGERVAASADVYSLGVVLYELFAGRPMFDVSSGDSMLRAHVYTAPAKLEGVPGPVWAVLETALRKEASQRFATAAELSAALDAAVAAEGATSSTWVANWSKVQASPHHPLDATYPSSVRRARTPLLVIGGAAVMGLGAVALYTMRPDPVPVTPPLAVKAAPAEVETVDAGPAPIAEVSAPEPAQTRPASKRPPKPEEPPPLLPR